MHQARRLLVGSLFAFLITAGGTPWAPAWAASIPIGEGPGPSTLSSTSALLFPGNLSWIFGSLVGPLEAHFDPTAGPWRTELLAPSGTAPGAAWIDDSNVVEGERRALGLSRNLVITGETAWQGLHIEFEPAAFDAGWRWILNPAVQRVHVGGTLPSGHQSAISADQRSVDITFDPLAPGTVLNLFGQPFFAGPDGIAGTGDLFSGSLVVGHTLVPVRAVPEPGTVWLLLAAGAVALGRRRRRAGASPAGAGLTGRSKTAD